MRCGCRVGLAGAGSRSGPGYPNGVRSRGTTLTVASRARVPTIGLSYGLSRYLVRKASVMRSLTGPSTLSKRTCWWRSSPRGSWRDGSTQSCTGRPSSPRPRSARPWRTSPRGPSGSATQAAPHCCWPASWRYSGPLYTSERTLSVDTVSSPRVEAFYWGAISFSQTLGTALGDWLADTNGLGNEGGALVFGAGLAAVIALYYATRLSP